MDVPIVRLFWRDGLWNDVEWGHSLLLEQSSVRKEPSLALWCGNDNISDERFASSQIIEPRIWIMRFVFVGIPVNIATSSLRDIMLTFLVHRHSVVTKFWWPPRFDGPITMPVVCYTPLLRLCFCTTVEFRRYVQMTPAGLRGHLSKKTSTWRRLVLCSLSGRIFESYHRLAAAW